MKISSNTQDIINQLNIFSKTLNIRLDKSIEELGKEVQSVAKSNVISFDKDPNTASNIIESIMLYIELGGKKATIVSEDVNSIFYEYGTGIIGMHNPHPESAEANWIYNIDTEYKRVSSVTGETGWFHQFEGTDHAIFMSGQPASAFMFKAFNYALQYGQVALSRNIDKALRETFKNK